MLLLFLIPLYEVSRVVEFTETKSGMVVIGAGGGENGELLGFTR